MHHNMVGKRPLTKHVPHDDRRPTTESCTFQHEYFLKLHIRKQREMFLSAYKLSACMNRITKSVPPLGKTHTDLTYSKPPPHMVNLPHIW